MKIAPVAATLTTALLLAACSGGSAVGQVVNDHYAAMSDGEKSALCDLWNSGPDVQDNMVEIEMTLAPDWDGGDALTPDNEQELGDAIFAWYDGNC